MNKSNLLATLLVLVLVFPAFGGRWSEQHILFLAILVAFYSVMLGGKNFKKTDFMPVVFFCFLQILLLISWFFDIQKGGASTSDVLSLMRPTGMAIIYLGTLAFIVRGCHLAVVGKFIISATVALLLSFLLALFAPGYAQISKALYFPIERFKDFVFISYFGTTYFAAYFYYITFLYSAVRISIFGFKKRWFIITILSSAFIFFSQSKTAYVALIFSIFILFYLKSRLILRPAIFSFMGIGLFLFFYHQEEVVEFLFALNYFSLSQLARLIQGGSEFGAAAERIAQVISSASMSFENSFLGVGLGRNVLLESYIATYIYRYGILGFIFYSFFYLSVSFYAFKKAKSEIENRRRVLYLFGAIWFLNIPLLMLSNPMFEMGKNSVFSMVILALMFGADRMRHTKHFAAELCCRLNTNALLSGSTTRNEEAFNGKKTT